MENFNWNYISFGIYNDGISAITVGKHFNSLIFVISNSLIDAISVRVR